MHRLVPGILCPLLLWCGLAAAQEAGGPSRPDVGGAPSAPPAGPSSGPIQESQLPVYLSEDEQGEPVLMIGWTLDAFEQLLQENMRLRPPGELPGDRLQSMSATGTAKRNHADLTIEFTVAFTDEHPVRLPLRLDQGVICGDVRYDGPGQPLLGFEEEGDGYVCTIRGEPGKQHHLTLEVLAPLARVGGKTRLRLSAPRVAKSELKFKVPGAEAVGEVSGGALLLSASAADDGTTEFEVQGLGGDFELTWWKANSPAAEAPALLEAVGSVLAKVDGRSVHTEATLRVQGHGKRFGSFHVRLPEGAELIPGNSTEYAVVPVPSNAENGEGRQLVEIQLPGGEAEEVEVSLAAKRSLESLGPAEWFELGGFEVLEATRQWGHLSIAVAGQWHVFLSPNRQVQQVDELPLAAQEENLVASFEYFSQPFSLTARVAPKMTRVSVEPLYQLFVDEDRVRLKATLSYTVRGAEVSALEVELPGWRHDDVEPYELIPVGGTVADASGRLSIALSQPMNGKFEIAILAEREIEAGSTSLHLPLPRPQADSLRPATVIVSPAENVELTPDAEQTVGLIRQQAGPPIAPSERRQAPLYYRGETAEAVFVADMTVHERSVSVQVSSEVRLETAQARVDQKLAYQIEYKRLGELIIEVPARLAESDAMEVFLDGLRLSPVDCVDRADSADGSAPVRKRVVLPEPWLGSCELGLRYRIDVGPLRPEASTLCVVPLVMPAEGELSSHRLRVTAEPGVTIEHIAEPWVESEHSVGPAERGLQLTAPARTSAVTLGLRLEDRDAAVSTVIERAWVQTWMDRSLRQDRAVFSFTTDRKEIELVVPAGVDPGAVELVLNGKRVQAEKWHDHSLRIALPEDSNHRVHRLEVGYAFPGKRSGPGRLSLELPRLGRGAWMRRMYWQLTLPRDEHLVVGPKGLASEFHWGWNGTFWGRMPVWEQADLEAWCGVPSLNPGPAPAATSRYLFSSLGPVERCEVWTASRSLIVLAASAIALIVGLMLMYVPLTRHPVALLAAAVALMSAALLHPGPTLLALEAASLGLALTLLAGLLQRSVARRRRMLPGETSSSVLDKGSTQTLRRAPPANDQQSPQTTAGATPAPNSDSNS